MALKHLKSMPRMHKTTNRSVLSCLFATYCIHCCPFHSIILHVPFTGLLSFVGLLFGLLTIHAFKHETMQMFTKIYSAFDVMNIEFFIMINIISWIMSPHNNGRMFCTNTTLHQGSEVERWGSDEPKPSKEPQQDVPCVKNMSSDTREE